MSSIDEADEAALRAEAPRCCGGGALVVRPDAPRDGLCRCIVLCARCGRVLVTREVPAKR